MLQHTAQSHHFFSVFPGCVAFMTKEQDITSHHSLMTLQQHSMWIEHCVVWLLFVFRLYCWFLFALLTEKTCYCRGRIMKEETAESDHLENKWFSQLGLELPVPFVKVRSVSNVGASHSAGLYSGPSPSAVFNSPGKKHRTHWNGQEGAATAAKIREWKWN